MTENTVFVLDDGSEVVEATGTVMGVKPTPYHMWDFDTDSWVDPRSIEDLKAEKIAELKGLREAVTDSPLVTPYGTFDCDRVSRANIADAVQLSDKLEQRGLPSDIGFILADNSQVILTNEEMGTVGLLLGQKTQSAYDMFVPLRDACEAATSNVELSSISWPDTI